MPTSQECIKKSKKYLIQTWRCPYIILISGGSSAVTPESEFADREVSYDEVAAVTAQVRIHSNHLSPVSPIGLLTKSEDVTDSVFSMDELTKSGLLTGECTGTGIVSVSGTIACELEPQKPSSGHAPAGLSSRIVML